jgi:hypothetical protein
MSYERWRGLVALVRDAVDGGSRAVERIQKETADKPFAILEAVPPIAVPAKIVHTVFDVSVAGVHGAVRLVNRAVGTAADMALALAEASAQAEAVQPALDAAAPTEADRDTTKDIPDEEPDDALDDAKGD